MTTTEFVQAVEAEKKRLGIMTDAEVARAMGKVHPSTLSKGIRGEIPIGNKLLRGLEKLKSTQSGVIHENHSDYGAPQESELLFVETTTPDGRPLKVPVSPETGGLIGAVNAARGQISGKAAAAMFEHLASDARVPMTPELRQLIEAIRQRQTISL